MITPSLMYIFMSIKSINISPSMGSILKSTVKIYQHFYNIDNEKVLYICKICEKTCHFPKLKVKKI